MYCDNCGEEIEAGADFCPNCGTRITNKAGNKKILPKTNKENGDRKSSRTRFAIIAIIAGLIILNIVLLIYREIGLDIYNRRGGLFKSDMKKLNIQVKTINSDDIEIGDYITFGRYEQDNDSTNGAEDIEWRVLDKATVDSNGKNCILVISRYALDRLPYNAYNVYKDFEGGCDEVTWETCDLRKWLNNEFYYGAFSEVERNQLLTIKNNNPDASSYERRWYGKGGNATSDNVFLLSYEQAENYFENDDDRECCPTDFAMWNGSSVGNEHHCKWWLRSPGESQYEAMQVLYDGHLYSDLDYGYSSVVTSGGICVRPALWIYAD